MYAVYTLLTFLALRTRFKMLSHPERNQEINLLSQVIVARIEVDIERQNFFKIITGKSRREKFRGVIFSG